VTGSHRARPLRSWSAYVGVAALVALSSLLVGVTPAAAATNLIQNNGMETLAADGFPSCWEKSGWGNNDFTFSVVAPAHGGTRAMQIAMPRRVDGDRKAMMLESPACAPNVVPGKQYDLSVWYKTNTPNTLITAFRRDKTAGWQYWMDLKQLPVVTAFTNAVVRTPVVPANTDQISWGVTIYGVGTVVTDDYTMTDPNETTPPPTCTGGAACTKGSWQIVATQSPARGIHNVVLRNGKVLLIAGSGNDENAFAAGTFSTTVFDPVTGAFTNVPTPADFFCAGHVQLRDGRVLVMGGNKNYPVPGGHGYEGLRVSYIFDPATNTYTRTNDMNAGHWYPSATALGNGDVLSLGGLGEDSAGTVSTEYFSSAQNRWLGLNEVKQTYAFWGLYPAMVLMQDGRLFYTGSHVFGNGLAGTGASIYNYDAATITDVPGLRDKDNRDQSASVLLPPAQDQRVLTIGGGNVETNPDANRLVDLIDLKKPNPGYVAGPALPQGTNFGGGAQTGTQGKMYVSAVILPDGKVFETGGALHNRADAVAEASMFNPQTNTFTAGMATDPVPRGYHSSAALLPDGRVLAAGNNPGDGSFDNRLSIYSPPYLFKGARPVINTVANPNWAYGSTQQITVNSAVTSAVLIRPAAVTHSSDPNQRSVALPMTVTGNNVGLNVTTNPNMAPPGWYMLFVTNSAGVPSVAKWVKLG
jgi:Domain of unknown function (DUF1929)